MQYLLTQNRYLTEEGEEPLPVCLLNDEIEGRQRTHLFTAFVQQKNHTVVVFQPRCSP